MKSIAARFALATLTFLICFASHVAAQTTTVQAVMQSTPAIGNQSAMDDVRRQLREQQAEIERLRETLAEQSRLINEIRASQNIAGTSTNAAAQTALTPSPSTQDASQSVTPATFESRITQLETQTRAVNERGEKLSRQFGNLTFSGDLRLRYESFYGQLNSQTNADNPAILGNPLSSRQRFRVRARLTARGSIGKNFDFGLRLASGSFADSISTNLTLGDFFNRKPFALDQAFIAYKPTQVPGLRLQAGKFEIPWTHTEMTLDDDLQVEGASEIYSREYKKSKFKRFDLIAWQLPFLERNSTFVRNDDGTVNVEESKRGGRDLALYGGQVRARIEPTSNAALTFSAANLHFAGTQFITPINFLGANIQLPVTVTIPATATTPAQIVTTQVNIPRELLVSGNGNLGLSTASNNAVNRNGRFASGFNLVDIIARADLTQSKRFPVSLIFNFVTNTQTRDVVSADANGANVIQTNREKNGYWAEVQVGKVRERGDMLFGYTFTRIEKDAVLTPFNFSDFVQQSDVHANKFSFAYVADARVTLALTSIVSQRANGLGGAFGATPEGSLNRPTTRLQLDTIFRF